jgi:hypothetical protein
MSRYTAVIEYFRTDSETSGMYTPEFDCTESEAISEARWMVDQLNAQPARIVDHARVEDADGNIVWQS